MQLNYILDIMHTLKMSRIKCVITHAIIIVWVLTSQPGCKQQPEKKAPVNSERVAINMENVRPPAVAGTFYPADPSRLSKQINDFLAQAPKTEVKGEIVALISPHAGYVYSGGVAAYAYKLLEGLKYDVVVVVAPSHYAPFHGASVYSTGGYQLPTGIIPIHEQLAKQIINQHDAIDFVPKAHAREHSLEVQLPFLQQVLGDFKLVPIVMGSQDMGTCQILAQAIASSVKGYRALIVASSDLSHFYQYDKAVQLDRIVQEKVNNFDPEGLSRDLGQRICEACGGGPIVTVLMAARLLGADKAQVLKYANSGDVTGEKDRVVGYMAAVAYKSQAAGKGEIESEGNEKVGVDMGLTDEEKKKLHHIASETIEKTCQGDVPPHFTSLTSRLKEKRGAFVTLKKNGRLRGCIGYIMALKPLYLTIEEMAQAAAFNDPRFPPVTSAEVPELEIEISVLTPLRKITNVDEIIIGRDGIYLKQGLNTGLLLPQVATENHWNRTTFLQNTCRKAGLPSNAWQDKDIEIYIFSADIF
jgi:AmmeMemoRadiSam system protein B/AmmeMemoRadiSam system protein A